MSYIITAGKWPISLNETDEENSILQNVAMILASPRGSIPLYRDFGLSMQALDRPIQVAKVLLIAEIREIIEAFEPRASVTGVTFEIDPEDSGHLIPTVTIEIV